MTLQSVASVHEPPFVLTNFQLWPDDARQGNVMAVGPDGRLRYIGRRPHEASNEQTVDGQGAHLIPGFIDAHVHVRASASARASIDISDYSTTAQILETIREQRPRSGWMSLWGLQSETLSGAPPTAEQLDEASGGLPVRIRHRSSHAWIFSGTALARFGLASAPRAGVHVERREDRSPTGFVVDHSGWVGDQVGRITSPSRLTAEVSAWSVSLAREGIVALVDATARNGPVELQQLADWRAQEVILQRVVAMSSVDITQAPDPLRFGGHKLMPPFPTDLHLLIKESWAQRIPVAVHCVTLDELGCLIEAVEAIPPQLRGALRIEHASSCPREWLERLAALQPTIVTHPAFVRVHGDRYLADPTLAPHEWLYRVASWQDAGLTVAFASDAPAGPTSPLLQIQAAVDRRTAQGSVLGPSEAVSLRAAVTCVTGSAAAAAGLGREGFGTWTEGMRANGVLIGAAPGGLADPEATVLATIIDGRFVWWRDPRPVSNRLDPANNGDAQV